MAKPKSDEAINFDSVIKNLSSDTKASDVPWFKKKSSIIAMSSTLGVGALATVIAVPIALTSGSNSSEAPIDAFNNKSTLQKIDLYNSIMENPSNNIAIKDYITQASNGGMLKFIDANVTTPTNQETLTLFNNFKSFLITSSLNNVSLNNFLKIIGIKSTTGNLTNNNNTSSRYFTHATTINNDGVVLSFFSPIKDTIADVTMSNNLSMNMTLPKDSSNIAFTIRDKFATDHLIYYKEKITFNNSTLFPGMTAYVKTSILKLT